MNTFRFWTCFFLPLPFVFTLFLGTGYVHAQEEEVFLVEDLEGWEEAHGNLQFQEYYDFDRFLKWNGRKVSAAKYKTLHMEWAEERKRVEKKIEEIQKGPIERFKTRLKGDLQKHSYFGRVRDYDWVDEKQPFIFLVQQPPDRDPKYKEEVAYWYSTVLGELERFFIKEYVKPLQWKKKDDHALFAFLVLATEGGYMAYAKAVEELSLYFSRAHYDPENRLAVTYREFFAKDGTRAADEEFRTVLHEFVHVLQHAYSRGKDLPRTAWFNEGLAEYLSSKCTPTQMGQEISFGMDLLVLAPMLNPKTADSGLLYLNPLHDLVNIKGPGYAEIMEKATQRAKKLGAYPLGQKCIETFYAQSSLLMRFLHEGAGKRYREGIMRYIGDVMAGRHGWETFAQAFHDIGPPNALEEAIETEFYDFVRKECKERWPKMDLGSGSVFGTSRLQGGKKTLMTDASFAPGNFALSPEEAEAQFGAVLYLVGRGAVSQALKWIDQFKEAEGSKGNASRLERERKRIERFDRFRREFFAAKKGRSVYFPMNGKTSICKIVNFEDDTLFLQPVKPRGPATKVPVSEVGPEVLLTALGKIKKIDMKSYETWLNGYLRILSGKPDFEEYLCEGGAEAESLRKDAEGYAKPLQQGEAAWVLESLAGLNPAMNKEEARDSLIKLKALKPHQDLDIVRRRRDDLKACAQTVLSVLAKPQELMARKLYGKIDISAESKIKLAYSFDNEAELEDFVEEKEYLKDLRSHCEKQTGKLRSEFIIRDGSLKALGATCLRHVLPFSSPFRVRYRFRFNSSSDPKSKKTPLLLLGTCDDSYGSFIGCSNLGLLQVLDFREGFFRFKAPIFKPIYTGKIYEIQLVHNGQGQIESFVDGKAETCISSGPRQRGKLFFWLHSEFEVEIEELQIQGILDSDSLKEFETEWIKTELEAMGFAD